jgi:hypothetical protein
MGGAGVSRWLYTEGWRLGKEELRLGGGGVESGGGVCELAKRGCAHRCAQPLRDGI